jgi:AcrR family transcriptional regulator
MGEAFVGARKKRNRFVSLIVGTEPDVNRNETVSFYLQAGQICIDWDTGFGRTLEQPAGKIAMKTSSLKKTPGAKKASAGRAAVRFGRPPKELAGEVDERILDAARRVFVERGFEGASIDEIAEVARAGKPTIYARLGDKRALFTTVVTRDIVSRITRFKDEVPPGATTEERLANLAAAIVHWTLETDRMGLMRLAIAEASRFPDLASTISRTARELSTEVAARHLGEITRSDQLGSLPAFAPERLATTARLFLDLVVVPFMLRALFEVNPKPLQAEIGPHVARSVAFFLAACRHDGVR